MQAVPSTMKFVGNRAGSLLLLLMFPGIPYADELQRVESAVDVLPARIYSTPAERRDAGLGTEITEWLTASGLLEIETGNSRENYSGRSDRRTSETDETLQLGLQLTFSETISSELVFE